MVVQNLLFSIFDYSEVTYPMPWEEVCMFCVLAIMKEEKIITIFHGSPIKILNIL